MFEKRRVAVPTGKSGTFRRILQKHGVPAMPEDTATETLPTGYFVRVRIPQKFCKPDQLSSLVTAVQADMDQLYSNVTVHHHVAKRGMTMQPLDCLRAVFHR